MVHLEFVSNKSEALHLHLHSLFQAALGSKPGTCDHYWLTVKTWKENVKGIV